MTRPAPNRAEIAVLIATYHRYGAERREEDFWAWYRVDDIIRDEDPARAWELVLALVQTAPDGSLDYIGAGPVEDLVNRHGAALVDSIIVEASRDSRFREALASIWLVQEDVPADVLVRLQKATGNRIHVATRAQLDAATPPDLKDPRS